MGEGLQQRFVLNRGNIRYIGKKQHGVFHEPRLRVGVRRVRDKPGELGRARVTEDIPASGPSTLSSGDIERVLS